MSRAKGNIGEDKASVFLEDNAYLIIEKNFYSRFGEIDIIASKDNVLHFIEVKSGLDYESAVQNITPSKLSKFIKTVHVYMKKNALDADFMIDAVIVTPQKIELIENITL
ncbi:YraN family protein [Sulfurimonas sp.]|jgi:putative endonuclease|uniref:YraN family protein n=1 Tax=Sulfurimonas sp. TaxID=2022749 RepID=UPI0025DF8AC7|nr:YraN family protein [Sulfurimonas sp.]MBT5934151.1 YraN family protein [Sulfurimonas sp.]